MTERILTRIIFFAGITAIAMSIALMPSPVFGHAAQPTGSGAGSPGDGGGGPPCKLPDCNCQNQSSPNPVDLFTGKKHFNYTDLSVPGTYSIRIQRFYDGHSRYDSPLGYGWAFVYDRRLHKYTDGSVVLRTNCGVRDRFVFSGGSYVPPPGTFKQLVENGDGTYTLTYQGGDKEFYDAEGRLTAKQDPQGNRLEMSYDPAGKLPLTGSSPFSLDPATPGVVAYDYRLTRVAERLAGGALSGNHVDFEYDPNSGRLNKIVASDGREVSYVQDQSTSAKNGNLIEVRGLDGEDNFYQYDDPNDPHNVTQYQTGAGAEPTVNTYDAQDRVIRQVQGDRQLDIDYTIPQFETVLIRTIKAPDGTVLHTATSTYEFNADGKVTTFTDALGHQEIKTYDSQLNVTRRELWQNDAGTLSLQQATDYTYNAAGNRLTETVTLDSGEVITTTRTYDHDWVASEEVVSSLEPATVFRTEYTFYYDAGGRPTNIQEAKRIKAGGSAQTTHYTYDAEGRVTVKRLPDGTETRYEYDPNPPHNGNYLTRVYYRIDTDNDGVADQDSPFLEREFTYDARGNQITETDAKGNTTTRAYDDQGRVITETNPLGEETHYTYDNRGNLTTIETGRTAADGEGQVTQMLYDTRNRLTEIQRKTDADTFATYQTYTYDSAGNRLTQADALNRTNTFEYDALNRLISTVDPLSNATQYAYDAAGNRISVTDALSRTTTFEYDNLNRLIETEQQGVSPAAVTTYTYDAQGNLLTVTDPENSTTTYDYDRLSRRIAVTQPLGQVDEYEFDERNRIVKMVNARDQRIEYVYEGWGGLSEERHYPDLTTQTPDRTIAQSYDENGNPVSSTDDTIQAGPMETRAYDALDRIDVYTAQYIPGGDQTVDYDYDRFGNRAGLTLDDGTTSIAGYTYDKRNRLNAATLPGSQAYSFTYNDADELIDKVYPNGITTTHTYQANGPVTGITTSTVQDLQYTYDAVLNVDTQNDSDGLHDYDYDGLDRLTGAVRPVASPLPDETYTYDGVGNREDPADNALYDYDANHRIQASPALTYTYDADGNTLTRSDGAGFSYDKLDRLTQYTQSATTASYAYNPRNQRIRKDVDGTATWFLWSEGILLAEYDGTGQRTRRYDTLPGEYLPTQMEAGGATLHIHGDHLQTPREITDDAGTVVWASRHEAFGAVTVDEDPDGDSATVTFNHRFPGQYEDVESGMYYNWNRYYNPETGRYFTSDPIGLQGGLNTYSYVDGNPARFMDPIGLYLQGVIIGGGVRIIGGRAAGAAAGAGLRGLLGRRAGNVAACLLLLDCDGPDDDECDDDRCEKAKQDARRIYRELVTRAIPQYLYGTRTNSADDGHLQAIHQMQTRLRDALRRVRLYCNPLPLEYPKWERLANQDFPRRH